MLVFVDESYTPGGSPNAKTTFAAVVIDEKNYRNLERDLYKLRKHFFKNPDPYQVELKGRLLLSERAIEMPKNREFVRQLISLCSENELVPFAVVQDGSITLASQSDYLPSLYRGVLWRVNTLMEEKHHDGIATVFFDSIDHETNKRIAISFTNFMVRHYRGTQYENVLPTPFFCDSSVTPPMQIADVVAYCVNQRYVGRRGRLEEFFLQFRELTFNYQNQEQDLLLWGFSRIPLEHVEPIPVEQEPAAQEVMPLGEQAT